MKNSDSVQSTATWSLSPGTLVVAIVLLIGSGAGFRVLAAYYARPPDSVPIPKGTLGKLPLQIGDWTGRDLPMDERVIRATDTDDLVNRCYERSGSREAVSFFVAYGVRLRDLAPHRPEVCYPGAGWTLDENRTIDLKAVDGSTLPCRILRFHRGGLESERIIVLNYYIVDGHYCPDVALLRSRVWRTNGGAKYSAQVQITCPYGAFQDAPGESVRTFAADSAPAVRELLAKAVAESSPGH
jgi:EpsI family protein